jgi:Arabidopsis thaliana protein of unknown function (DUF821).
VELDEFMCPTVHPETARLRDQPELLARFPALMAMLCDFDRDRIVYQTGETAAGASGGARQAVLAESPALAPAYSPTVFDNIRRGLRSAQMIEQLGAKGVRWFVSNMHDCSPFAPELYVGAPANIFQHNRRRGDPSPVLWRLIGYYEPGPIMGGVPPDARHTDTIPFTDKRPRIVWRGNWTGITWTSPYDITRIGAHSTAEALAPLATLYPRARAVMRSLAEPEFLDCRFVAGGKVRRKRGTGGAPWGELEDRKRTQEWLLRNRYQLCLPGNDTATQLYWVINSNSLALKVETEFDCIADYFLKPWVHYVPIARDLGDLREKYEYCEANPGLCLAIIERGKEAYARMLDASIWEEAETKVLDRLGLLA